MTDDELALEADRALARASRKYQLLTAAVQMGDEAVREAWHDYLQAWKTALNKFNKIGGQVAKKAWVKTDGEVERTPVLRYLDNARGEFEHGLQPVSAQGAPKIAVSDMRGGMLMRGQFIPLQPNAMIKSRVVPGRLKAAPIERRINGKVETIHPPGHIDPTDLAESGLEYLGDVHRRVRDLLAADPRP